MWPLIQNKINALGIRLRETLLDQGAGLIQSSWIDANCTLYVCYSDPSFAFETLEYQRYLDEIQFTLLCMAGGQLKIIATKDTKMAFAEATVVLKGGVLYAVLEEDYADNIVRMVPVVKWIEDHINRELSALYQNTGFPVVGVELV